MIVSSETSFFTNISSMMNFVNSGWGKDNNEANIRVIKAIIPFRQFEIRYGLSFFNKAI